MLKTRILTALALLPLVLLCLFVAPIWGWGAFVLLALSFGAWEWARLAQFNKNETTVFVATFVGLGAAGLWLPQAQMWQLPLAGLSLLFWLALVPAWLWGKWTLRRKWTAALVGWLLLLAALLGSVWLRQLKSGALGLLLVLGIAWVADIAAYFAGRRFGRRKLAPTISPGKSWEGVYGALLAVSVYALALHYAKAPLFSALTPWLLLPLVWVLTAVSVMGDLFESLLKRQAGLKDSSNLLPGHGGVLDRLDSLIALVPVTTAFLLFAFFIV
ncbi:phosphatidate cytidylyltransferase [Chitinimonas lacunae]|uniref:Phosphatidate cytidylyltransferase n=1 Tax=Chitinimonas lacunae TaxID=1963018 RepID=A0ABV8MXI9_9NEIS